MSGLECFEKSSVVSQKEAVLNSASRHDDDNTFDDKVRREKVNENICSFPAHTQPYSEQVSCPETENAEEGLITEEQSPKELISDTPRAGEEDLSRAGPDEELQRNEFMNLQPPDSTTVLRCGTAEDEEQADEEDADDEDLKVPLEVILELLQALNDKDYELACKLCEMVLIYEPKHPDASELLTLIQQMRPNGGSSAHKTPVLPGAHSAAHSHHVFTSEQDSEEDSEEEEGEEDNEDSECDDKSSRSSSCSSSSSDEDEGDDGDDEGDDDEKQVNRHKPCPPSYESP